MIALSFPDILVILFYFIVVVGIATYFGYRKSETSRGFFLADNQLGWFVIGASLFAANISTEHFLGLAGSGANDGLVVGNFEWLAIFFIMALGWILAPIFLRSKVFTVPEFFGKRFNSTARLYLAGISILAYIITKSSISLFAGGILMEHMLGWDMYTSAILMMIITGIYTIVGGMSAVVYTSVVQAFFLIAGAILMTYFGLLEVGGWGALKAQLPADYFSIIKPMSDPDFPWTGILFGAPIIGIWYWCTDQYIVQRVLCAKDEKSARYGAVFTSALKLLPLFILVVPGLIAAVLYPGVRGDDAYPMLLAGNLLPTGIKGLVVAGVLAALMSSLATCFHSTATLFTMDFYRHFYPDAPEIRLVLIGRLSTMVMVIIGLVWISLSKYINAHLYIFLQSIQAFISPPITAVFLLGLFWKRLNGNGAVVALAGGGVISAFRVGLMFVPAKTVAQFPALQWLADLNYLHFAIYLFLISSALLVAGSFLSPDDRKDVSAYTISGITLARGRAVLAGFLSASRRQLFFFSLMVIAALISLWQNIF